MPIAHLTRRTLMKLASLVPAAKIVSISMAQAQDQNQKFVHALSMFGDVKYGPDFKHFDYANPQAPKGGKVRIGAVGSFDSLNSHTIKGDSIGVEGTETLVTSSLDEPFTEYGLIAKEIWHPEDRSRVVFRLRPEAKFHDGKPITVEDVIWSMEVQKKNLPNIQQYFQNVVKLEQTGDHEVTFIFDKGGNRELPLISGQLSVLPKHWWTGKDANGKDRDINSTTMEIPLGSGAYKIAEAKAGQSIKLKRVEDYWGKDLPINAGQNNFDEIEYIFFKDAQVVFEAFKGDQYDWRRENSSKGWATGYDVPAVKDGRLIKDEVKLKQVQGLQAWVMNLRKPKFQDVRVRRALNLAFDFEWSNQNLFYGLYTRSRSLFNNSDMEAKGTPSPEELALLEPLRADLPEELFTGAYTNPVNDTPQNRRKNLREAQKLLTEAGWAITKSGGNNILKNDKGEKLDIEFLLDSPLFERIALPYQQQLELLGIGVTIRTIDAAQYERRTETYDYDIISHAWGQSLSPGNEQRYFWGSAFADTPGNQNFAGIKNKAIDTLIDKVIFAPDRPGLITACKALDRAIMANHFFVPMWYNPVVWTAYWDRFGKPDKQPDYNLAFPSTWWRDEAKAKKVKG
jgi:microcin C transport system substrate-binding protein